MKPFRTHVRVSLPGWAFCAVVAFAACSKDTPRTATFVAPAYGDPCRYFECANQGVCVTNAGTGNSGPMCQCVTGFAGEHCDDCDAGFHKDAKNRCVPDKRCADQPANPCGAHGECNDEVGVIACTCDAGYQGPRCTLCAPGYGRDSADECLQKVLTDGRLATVPTSCTGDPCQGHGQCTDTDGTIVCDCFPGYLGGRCESCADGYTKPAGSSRCVPSMSCDASACGSCTPFDGDPDFPNHPDTCVSSRELQIDDMILWSVGGEGTLWLCAASSRYGLDSEHVALEAGNRLPAEITFRSAIAGLSFDYAAWETLSLDLLGDDVQLKTLSAARYTKGSVSLSFDPPIQVLGFRSQDDFAHTLAIDNIVVEPALCK